jgi:hypothetical protein
VSAVYDNCVSNSDTVHTGFVSSLSDPKFNQFKMIVYPQPALNSVTVSSDIEIEKFSIINIQGKIILSKDNIHHKDITSDISMIPSGLYIIELKNSLGTARKKIIIK